MIYFEYYFSPLASIQAPCPPVKVASQSQFGGTQLHLVIKVALAVPCVLLGACAGRDAAPVAVVQAHDQNSDCAMITAEIEANNAKATQLAEEQGMKVAQNVAAGVVGLVIWPVWFAMDAKGAASTDAAALKARQEYLSRLAEQRCAKPSASPPPAQRRRT